MKFDCKKIRQIAQKYNLKLIVLFGSQTEGKIHPESDLDIAFFPSKKINEEKLYQDLIILLKRADIDLVNLFSVHDHLLRYEILSKSKVLYESTEGLKSMMEWQSFIDYVDFKKYYQMRSKLLDKKIAELSA